MKNNLEHLASLWISAPPDARRAAVAALERKPEPRAPVPEPAERPMLLSQRDAARLLGLSRQTIFRWSRLGILSPVVIAGVRRYRYADLEKLARGESVTASAGIP
jgi:hypothetical protein